MLVNVDSRSLTGEEVTLDRIYNEGYTGVPIGLSSPVLSARGIHLRKVSIRNRQNMIVPNYNDKVKFWDGATGTTTEYEITMPNNVASMDDIATELASRMSAADATATWNCDWELDIYQFHIWNDGTAIRLDMRGNPFSFLIGWPTDTEETFGPDLWLPRATPYGERHVLYLSFDELQMDQNNVVNALNVPNMFATIYLLNIGANPPTEIANGFEIPSTCQNFMPTQVHTIILREIGSTFFRLTPRFWTLIGTRFKEYNLNSTHFAIELFIETTDTRNQRSVQSQYY